jgi:hypothetical protein
MKNDKLKKNIISSYSESSPETYEDFSILDLLDQEEGGPVLKRRPPEAPGYPSHPDEFIYQEINKKALGLTDIPKAGPYGTVVSRPQEVYEEQDFEVSNKTGFGGPSVIDVPEDKPPVNIKRKTHSNKAKNETINKKQEIVYSPTSYFDWLYSGKLKREIGEKMSSQQNELLKLARILNTSGYQSEAKEIIEVVNRDFSKKAQEHRIMTSEEYSKLSGEKSSSETDPYKIFDPELAQKLIFFKRYWDSIPSDKKQLAKANPNKAFAKGAQGHMGWESFGITGAGNDEYLMVAAIYYGTDPNAPSTSKLGGALLDSELEKLRTSLESLVGVSLQTWAAGTSWEEIVEDDLDGTDYEAAKFAATKQAHMFFDPNQSRVIIPETMSKIPDAKLPKKKEEKEPTILKIDSEKSKSDSETSTPAAKEYSKKELSEGRGVEFLYPKEYDKNGPIHKLQSLLGVRVDGMFGPETKKAYTGLVGDDSPAKSPEEALKKVEQAKGKSKKFLVDDTILIGFLLVKEGEVPGLDLSDRPSGISSYERAKSYVDALDDNQRQILSDIYAESAEADRVKTDVALRNIANKKESASLGSASSKDEEVSGRVSDSGKYYIYGDLYLDKNTFVLFKMKDGQLQPAGSVTPAQRLSLMRLVPREDKRNARKALISLSGTERLASDDTDSIVKYNSDKDFEKITNKTASIGAFSARKERLKKMGR